MSQTVLFRLTVVVLALVGALTLYFSTYSRHASHDDTTAPSVPTSKPEGKAR